MNSVFKQSSIWLLLPIHGPCRRPSSLCRRMSLPRSSGGFPLIELRGCQAHRTWKAIFCRRGLSAILSVRRSYIVLSQTAYSIQLLQVARHPLVARRYVGSRASCCFTHQLRVAARRPSLRPEDRCQAASSRSHMWPATSRLVPSQGQGNPRQLFSSG